MIEKTFQMWGNMERPTTIKIDDEKISFHFKNEDQREYYWIDKGEWISDYAETRQGRDDNWHHHMSEKTWFSDGMYAFINKACGLTD